MRWRTTSRSWWRARQAAGSSGRRWMLFEWPCVGSGGPAGAHWACKLDWGGWKELGRDLERQHPTRRRTEVTTDAWRALEEKFRKPHPDEARALGAIERMVREVARAKDYAMKTEQTYHQAPGAAAAVLSLL